MRGQSHSEDGLSANHDVKGGDGVENRGITAAGC